MTKSKATHNCTYETMTTATPVQTRAVWTVHREGKTGSRTPGNLPVWWGHLLNGTESSRDGSSSWSWTFSLRAREHKERQMTRTPPSSFSNSSFDDEEEREEERKWVMDERRFGVCKVTFLSCMSVCLYLVINQVVTFLSFSRLNTWQEQERRKERNTPINCSPNSNPLWNQKGETLSSDTSEFVKWMKRMTFFNTSSIHSFFFCFSPFCLMYESVSFRYLVIQQVIHWESTSSAGIQSWRVKCLCW